jgi:hypothetical protein
LRSFLFTLKKPQGATPCDVADGPTFNRGFVVRGDCSIHADSHPAGFGADYENDTGLPGGTFFTGERQFTAKENEVFEITD